jgi:hypothetical protein
MRIGWLVLAAAIFAAPVAAQAAVYQHKAGVTPEAFLADQTACVKLASPPQPVKRPSQVVTVPNNPNLSAGQNAAAAGAAAGLIAIQQALDNRALRRDNFDACMAARGYVRRVLSYRDDHALNAMTPEEKAARLAEMAAAPNPTDRIAKDR